MSARDVEQREVKYKQTGRCKTPSTPRGSSQDRLQQRLRGRLSHGGSGRGGLPKGEVDREERRGAAGTRTAGKSSYTDLKAESPWGRWSSLGDPWKGSDAAEGQRSRLSPGERGGCGALGLRGHGQWQTPSAAKGPSVGFSCVIQ